MLPPVIVHFITDRNNHNTPSVFGNEETALPFTDFLLLTFIMEDKKDLLMTSQENQCSFKAESNFQP